MRTLQWGKIPANKVVGKSNVWTIVGDTFNGYNLDYSQIEELFAKSAPQPQNHSGTQGKSKDVTDGQEKKKKDEIINLLDGKRSLNINIFLRQFRMTNEEIVQLIKSGNSEAIGAEKLRGLMKILPTQDEIEMLKSFDGDKEKLGSAEKFILQLLEVPNYKLRTDGLLIREEFKQNMDWIKPSIDSIILAARDLKESKELQEIFFLVLVAGNFMNAGGYAGDAAGFKMSSLLKLTEIRANKPRMNMMHFLTMHLEQKNQELLSFPDKMKFLKEASQTSVDSIHSDIKGLSERVRSMSEQIAKTGQDFQSQMVDFLHYAQEEIVELEFDLEEVEVLRKELAEFLCEDVDSFKLEDCFKTFQTFCDRFLKAIDENHHRKIQEEKAEQRKKLKEAADAKKKARPASDPEEKSNIIDRLLGDIKSGHINKDGGEEMGGDFARSGYARGSLTRRGIYPGKMKAIEEMEKRPHSADVGALCRKRDDKEASGSQLTDSASPRRRRGATPSAGDETLLDYLIQTGDETTDESKMKPKWEDVIIDKTGNVSRRRRERSVRRGTSDNAFSDREREARSPACAAQGRRWRSELDKDEIEVILREKDGNESISREPSSSSCELQDDSVFSNVRLDEKQNGKSNAETSLPNLSGGNSDELSSPRQSGAPPPQPPTEKIPMTPEEEKLAERNRRRNERKGRAKRDTPKLKENQNEQNTDVTQVSSTSQNVEINEGDNTAKSISAESKEKSPLDVAIERRQRARSMRQQRCSVDVRDVRSALQTDGSSGLPKHVTPVSDGSNKQKDVVPRTTDSLPDKPASGDELHKQRFMRRSRSMLNPSEIASVIRHIDALPEMTTESAETQVKEQNNNDVVKSQPNHDQSLSSPYISHSKRWRSTLERTDIDRAIKDMELTVKDIDNIGLDGTQDGKNETAKEEKAALSNGALKPRTIRARKYSATATSAFEWRDTSVSDKTAALLTSGSPKTAEMVTTDGVDNSVQARSKRRWRSFLKDRHYDETESKVTSPSSPKPEMGSIDSNSESINANGEETARPALVKRSSKRWRQELALHYSEGVGNDHASPVVDDTPPPLPAKGWRHTMAGHEFDGMGDTLDSMLENHKLEEASPTNIVACTTDEGSEHVIQNSRGGSSTVLPRTSSECQMSTLSPDRTLSKAKSESLLDAQSPTSPSKSPLEPSTSLTERAWLEHSTGRWKSNIDLEQVQEAYVQHQENADDTGAKISSVPSESSSEAQQVRTGPGLQSGVPRKLLSPTNDNKPASRRWGCYLGEGDSSSNMDDLKSGNTEKVIDPSTKSTKARGIFRESTYDNLLNDTNGENGAVQQASDLKSAARRWRSNIEAGEVNNAIKQFETRLADKSPKKTSDVRNIQTGLASIRRQKFEQAQQKSLEGDKKIILSSTLPRKSSSDEAESPVKLRRRYFDPKENLLNRNDVTPPLSSPASDSLGQEDLQDNDRSRIVKVDDATTVIIDDKSNSIGLDSLGFGNDTESECDTGFETETQSDTVSQRTSMSSTLDAELPGTPTCTRKKVMTPQTETSEELEEVKNQLARSTELINRTISTESDSRHSDVFPCDVTPMAKSGSVSSQAVYSSDSTSDYDNLYSPLEMAQKLAPQANVYSCQDISTASVKERLTPQLNISKTTSDSSASLTSTLSTDSVQSVKRLQPTIPASTATLKSRSGSMTSVASTESKDSSSTIKTKVHRSSTFTPASRTRPTANNTKMGISALQMKPTTVTGKTKTSSPMSESSPQKSSQKATSGMSRLLAPTQSSRARKESNNTPTKSASRSTPNSRSRNTTPAPSSKSTRSSSPARSDLSISSERSNVSKTRSNTNVPLRSGSTRVSSGGRNRTSSESSQPNAQSTRPASRVGTPPSTVSSSNGIPIPSKSSRKDTPTVEGPFKRNISTRSTFRGDAVSTRTPSTTPQFQRGTPTRSSLRLEITPTGVSRKAEVPKSLPLQSKTNSSRRSFSSQNAENKGTVLRKFGLIGRPKSENDRTTDVTWV